MENNSQTAVDMTATLDSDLISALEQEFLNAPIDGVKEETKETTMPAPEQSEATIEVKETKPEILLKAEEEGTTKEPVKQEDATEQISNPPTRYEGETDTQHQIRTELWRAGRAKATADGDEEKSLITQRIKELRKGLLDESNKSRIQSTTQPVTPQKESAIETTENQTDNSPSEEEAARVALEKLGYLDKKGVEAMLMKAMEAQKAETASHEHGQAITDFYKTRPDLAVDSIKKGLLENYVLDNFNLSPSTTKIQLSASIEMAANYLFPKVDKTANASAATAKRTVVNTSSNVNTSSQATDESIAKTMRDMGYTEEDIRNSGW